MKHIQSINYSRKCLLCTGDNYARDTNVKHRHSINYSRKRLLCTGDNYARDTNVMHRQSINYESKYFFFVLGFIRQEVYMLSTDSQLNTKAGSS